MTDSRTLPPNPEGQNDARAQWAETAIRQFQISIWLTGPLSSNES